MRDALVTSCMFIKLKMESLAFIYLALNGLHQRLRATGTGELHCANLCILE
jgi:hypothetical protein